MPEVVTALGGARFEGLARVAEARPRGMIALKGDLAASAVRNAAAHVAGVDVPGALRCAMAGEHGLGWMAPDELLILVPYPEVVPALEALQDALVGEHATVVDVSDARALLRVEGAGARDVLAKLTPADLAPDVFSPGTLRRTRLAQVSAAIWAEADGAFGVLCFRSVASYVFDLLANAAHEGGRVGYFPAGG